MKVRDIPIGTYHVFIDGTNIGSINVSISGGGGPAKGELELTGVQVPVIVIGSLVDIQDSLGNTILQGTFAQDDQDD